MLSLDIRTVDKAQLEALCSANAAEGSTLEFKRDLPGTSDRDKHEFLKDVCAFANSDGGDLVYGVAEKAGCASAISPLQEESTDAIQRRLAQCIDSGLEPRLTGIQFHSVTVDDGFCLVIRVPASFDGPHRFHSNGHSRFVMRNGTHITDLTYGQIRSAFDRSSTLVERVRAFLAERQIAISSRTTCRPVCSGPVGVVQLVPIASVSGRVSVDVSTLSRDYGRYIGTGWGGGSATLNLDGLFVSPGRTGVGEAVTDYCQVFRGGALEAVTACGFDREGKKYISSTSVTAFFREWTQVLLDAGRALGLSGPAIVRVSLLGAAGYEFAVGDRWFHRANSFSDREDLVLPDAWIESISEAVDVDTHARPMMDILWQSIGVVKCFEYNDKGVWTPRHL